MSERSLFGTSRGYNSVDWFRWSVLNRLWPYLRAKVVWIPVYSNERVATRW